MYLYQKTFILIACSELCTGVWLGNFTEKDQIQQTDIILKRILNDMEQYSMGCGNLAQFRNNLEAVLFIVMNFCSKKCREFLN